MVNGTYFALTGEYSWTALLASLVPFFLVSNLLLINQFPDLEADRAAGRRHLIIVHGRRAGVLAYTLFLAGCYLAILIGVTAGALPPWALLGLLTLPLAVHVARGLAAEQENIPALVPFLGKNVILTLATPLLLAVGIFVG
jgi:1,4-dihydroxy-2-naphthoate octaprenyltransferase